MEYFFGKMKQYCQIYGSHGSLYASRFELQPSSNNDGAEPHIKNSIDVKAHENLNNSSFWIFLGYSILISLWGIYITRNYLMDDALITLRYSYNFSKYGIPIWNQADLENPSMGYTSLLWMAINGIPALFISNKDNLVLMAKFFSFVALIVIIYLISREVFSLSISSPIKFLAVFIIFSQFGYGLHVNSAMETMLFSCMLLLTAKAYADSRYRLAYFFGMLSFLSRPEGALLVGLVFLWDLINRRFKQALSGVVVFAFLVAGILLLLNFWYGDVLPNTVYAKQEILNTEALARTVFFIVTLALPFLIMSRYAVFSLKNKTSYYMSFSAIVFIAYYVTVDPIMNVMSRYQWSGLVLLTYASIPTIEFLSKNIKRFKSAVIVLSLLLITTNIGNSLGASYFANATGHAMSNLIMIGKRMGEYRDPNQWLVYHDAGAISYFSDWNTHETIGLTNGLVARGQIDLIDIYMNPDAQIVMRNFDLMSEGQEKEKIEFTKMLLSYGYQHLQDISTLFVPSQRNFVVAVYARDLSFGKSVFQDVKITETLQPNIAYTLYSIARKIIKAR